jgi:mannose-1-phosphate guanylyltransferase/mannose-6-phosphate isomerase
MEKTTHAAVLPVEMGWNDVGSWDALYQIAARDGNDNLVVGDVLALDSRGNYLRAESGLVAALGVENLVVVATGDVVLVAAREKVEEVKALVDRLAAEGRPEASQPPVVYRPWGSFEDIKVGPHYQVKHLVIKPGAKISLQYHNQRAEHWVVVRGRARITRGDATFELDPDQSTYIPLGETHRLENPSDEPLEVIEVQTGDYLGEDDIVRLEDTYGRTGEGGPKNA